MTTTHPTHSYQSYAPNTSRRPQSSAYFFDKLGFKSAQASGQMRAAFMVDIGNHLSSPSHRFFNRHADPEAFKIVVSEFLTQYGPTYWGDIKRYQLQEPDPLKGFLCPRDAQRKDSTLIKAVEQFYNCKATQRRRKRSAALRELEDEEAGKEDSLNGVEGMESPQRDQHLPDSEISTQQTQTLEDDPADVYSMTASREPLLSRPRASSTRGSIDSTASDKFNRKSKRSHLYSGEPSIETAAYSSYQTPYPDDLTPPLTSTLEHDRFSEKPLILLDASDAGNEQRTRKPTTTSRSTSIETDKRVATISARGFEDVKMEPLTDDMMNRTMFLVAVHDSPIVPVPVPFTECGNFHVLFSTLIKERGVPDEDARKIDNITTVFTWTGGQFGRRVGGIRKNKPGDWIYFCDSLRKAHQMDADRFKGKCEVAIRLHINARLI